jgi:hypothetical protein
MSLSRDFLWLCCIFGPQVHQRAVSPILYMLYHGALVHSSRAHPIRSLVSRAQLRHLCRLQRFEWMVCSEWGFVHIVVCVLSCFGSFVAFLMHENFTLFLLCWFFSLHAAHSSSCRGPDSVLLFLELLLGLISSSRSSIHTREHPSFFS